MATLGSTGKTDSRQFDGKRKLLLVPLLPVPPALDDDHADLLERHWESVENQINNLEKTLGTVSSIFHEMLYGEGEQVESLLQQISPRSFPKDFAILFANTGLLLPENIFNSLSIIFNYFNSSWGVGIRTPTAGTKTRCPTIRRRPNT